MIGPARVSGWRRAGGGACSEFERPRTSVGKAGITTPPAHVKAVISRIPVLRRKQKTEPATLDRLDATRELSL
jgi:hypothetical protein